MKKIISVLAIFLLLAQINFASTPITTPELLGDGFSLEGALEMLKSAKTLKDFEEKLNKEDNYINNLDLNEDGDTDYIRVIDNQEDDIHIIILQAIINESELQDIAVIQVDKTGNEQAILQIIGDELLYGEEHIIEPYQVEGNPVGKPGPSCDYNLNRIVINVWLWPSVRYIYSPRYVVYHSPYHWNHYPRRWRPWRPLAIDIHLKNRRHYGHHHRVVKIHRIPKAHKIYSPKRKSSARVKRTTTVKYKKNGKKVKVKKTKVTTKNHKFTKKTKVKKSKNKKVKTVKKRHVKRR